MAKPAVVSSLSSVGNRKSDDDFVFDFVFVEKEFENDCQGETDDDADSYDYCEDVCSIMSNGNEQENEDVLLYDDRPTSPSTAGLKDSALTVPSVLLKDLDEAHEAARLTLMSDNEGTNDLVTTCSEDERVVDTEEKDTLSSPSQHSSVVVEQPEKEEMEEGPEPAQSETTISSMISDKKNGTSNENSPTLVPPDTEAPSIVPSDSNTIEEIHTSTIKPVSEKPAAPLKTFIIMPSAKPGSQPCFVLANFPPKATTGTSKDETPLVADNKSSAIPSSITTTATGSKKTSVSISRTSNKKRRKKLKMLKKAQAAEKFQQQAALLNISQGKISKKLLKQSKKQATPPRCASKKVANIAVSCALETMSSYRKELSAVQSK